MAIKHVLHFSLVLCTIGFQIPTICFQIWMLAEYGSTATTTTSSYFSIQYGPPVWFVGLMWTIVYIYQLLWIGYCLSTLWRRAPLSDERLYYEPYHVPASMYAALLLHFILALAWSADLADCNAVCPVLQFGALLTVAVALAVSLKALVYAGGALYRLGLSADVRWTRALLHNGLASYGTWLLVDLTVSLSGVMVHDGYSQKEATVTMLGVLGLILVVYVGVDVTLLDIYLRYTVTPYVALSLYFLAVVSAHTDAGMVYVTAALLLVLTLVGACFKLLVIVARRRSNPEPIPFAESTPQRTARRSSTIATRMSTRTSISGLAADTVAMPYM